MFDVEPKDKNEKSSALKEIEPTTKILQPELKGKEEASKDRLIQSDSIAEQKVAKLNKEGIESRDKWYNNPWLWIASGVIISSIVGISYYLTTETKPESSIYI